MKLNLTFVAAIIGLIVLATILYFKENADSKEGYNRYIESCVKAGEKEFTCRCQAGLLATKLPDSKLLLLAEAGNAMERGDNATVNKINQENPEIFTTLQEISNEAASCVLE